MTKSEITDKYWEEYLVYFKELVSEYENNAIPSIYGPSDEGFWRWYVNEKL